MCKAFLAEQEIILAVLNKNLLCTNWVCLVDIFNVFSFLHSSAPTIKYYKSLHHFYFAIVLFCNKFWHWVGIRSPVFHQFLGCFETQVNRQLDRVQDCREGRGERRVPQPGSHLVQTRTVGSQTTYSSCCCQGEGTVS